LWTASSTFARRSSSVVRAERLRELVDGGGLVALNEAEGLADGLRELGAGVVGGLLLRVGPRGARLAAQLLDLGLGLRGIGPRLVVRRRRGRLRRGRGLRRRGRGGGLLLLGRSCGRGGRGLGHG
jgi:hypothetical protein